MLGMALTLDKRIGLFPSGIDFGLFISPSSEAAVYERVGDYAALGVILGVLRVTMIEQRVSARWLESVDFDETVVSGGKYTPVDSDPEYLSSSSTATEDEEPNDQTPEPDIHSPSLLPNKSNGQKEKETWSAFNFPQCSHVWRLEPYDTHGRC